MGSLSQKRTTLARQTNKRYLHTPGGDKVSFVEHDNMLAGLNGDNAQAPQRLRVASPVSSCIVTLTVSVGTPLPVVTAAD